MGQRDVGGATQRAGGRARNVSGQSVVHAEYQAVLSGSRNPTMSIQVSQVKGDVVELIFNPREEDLRVGETLRIQERESGEGLVVQVVAFRMVTYTALVVEQLELVIGNAHPLSRDLLTHLSAAHETLQEYDATEARNLKIDIAKIRKLTGRRWHQ